MNDGFKMRYDKNTIDHLGIKLYSTFPPVIAELISNAYDADAENVKVTIDYDRKFVTVEDDRAIASYFSMKITKVKTKKNCRIDFINYQRIGYPQTVDLSNSLFYVKPNR